MSRSGATRPASTIPCCVPRTARSINCAAGTSSSMWTSRRSARTWWRGSSSRSTRPGPCPPGKPRWPTTWPGAGAADGAPGRHGRRPPRVPRRRARRPALRAVRGDRAGEEEQSAAHECPVEHRGGTRLCGVRGPGRGRRTYRPDRDLRQPARQHRPGGARGPVGRTGPMRDRYHRVRVARVIRETAEAVSLVLSVPPELSDTFRYFPGQYLTVRVPHAAGSVARCYSLCGSPFDGEPPTVTVKRTRGGQVSNWICDRVEAGTELDVMAPAGTFTPPSLHADLLLFAGGSGITPVMSILRAALSEGDGRVVLVYANRDAASVIFAAALADLAARYPDRLRVHHWYDVEAGPPTADVLRELVEPYAGYETFVCGPEPYMAVVEKALATLAVPPGRIHIERFDAGPAEPADSAAATVEVTMDGRTHRYP